MPLADLKRPSFFKRFKWIPANNQFVQVILEEGEDSFQRITCFKSGLLLELVTVRKIVNYIVGEVFLMGSVSAVALLFGHWYQA